MTYLLVFNAKRQNLFSPNTVFIGLQDSWFTSIFEEIAFTATCPSPALYILCFNEWPCSHSILATGNI